MPGRLHWLLEIEKTDTTNFVLRIALCDRAIVLNTRYAAGQYRSLVPEVILNLENWKAPTTHSTSPLTMASRRRSRKAREHADSSDSEPSYLKNSEDDYSSADLKQSSFEDEDVDSSLFDDESGDREASVPTINDSGSTSDGGDENDSSGDEKRKRHKIQSTSTAKRKEKRSSHPKVVPAKKSSMSKSRTAPADAFPIDDFASFEETGFSNGGVGGNDPFSAVEFPTTPTNHSSKRTELSLSRSTLDSYATSTELSFAGEEDDRDTFNFDTSVTSPMFNDDAFDSPSFDAFATDTIEPNDHKRKSRNGKSLVSVSSLREASATRPFSGDDDAFRTGNGFGDGFDDFGPALFAKPQTPVQRQAGAGTPKAKPSRIRGLAMRGKPPVPFAPTPEPMTPGGLSVTSVDYTCSTDGDGSTTLDDTTLSSSVITASVSLVRSDDGTSDTKRKKKKKDKKKKDKKRKKEKKKKKHRDRKHRRQKDNPVVDTKSESLLQLIANVNEAMLGLDDLENSESDDVDLDSTASQVLLGFEALTGILLQLSDDLELLIPSSRMRDIPVKESINSLLRFAQPLNDIFSELRPVLQYYLLHEISAELDDFFYGMNLLVDLISSLCNKVGEKQKWTPRANTSLATLLELLARDSTEATAIYNNVDTPPYELSDRIREAWAVSNHSDELKSLLYATDLSMFRQICYDVILSTDQWCPDVGGLRDVCCVEEDSFEDHIEASSDDELASLPYAAMQALDKVAGRCLRRANTFVAVIRRVLPPHAIADKPLLEHASRILRAAPQVDSLSISRIVCISSVPDTLNDPEALGMAGVGKTTMAAMVANHPDVRRYFNDGIAWIHIGNSILSYTRYSQCLQDLVSQLVIEKNEEPLFPELLHSPGESLSKRRRREEGFMIYVRETMVEFLRYRNVLIILDDVCREEDIEWFDFTPHSAATSDDPEGSCVVLITTRRRRLLPDIDTVEMDVMEEDEGVTLLRQEAGELSSALGSGTQSTVAVVRECANHPLAVKSVGRWLNLKHSTSGLDHDVESMHADIVQSMEKILENGNLEGADMMYEILDMTLSPMVNGEPSTIMKFCLAAFVRVFCTRKYLSDFSLAEATPPVPMELTRILFESLLNLEEEAFQKEGSLAVAQNSEAASVIIKAFSALGIFKIICSNPGPDEEYDPMSEQYAQLMHVVQQRYGEYLYEQDAALGELVADGDRRWNSVFAKAYLTQAAEWDVEAPDAEMDYSLEMMPSHMIRGGLFTEASNLLCNPQFVRGRLYALGRENATRRQIMDCEALFEQLREERAAGRKKLDARGIMITAYETLGSLLPMGEETFLLEEGSPEAVEVGRSNFEMGYSLAEKQCWEAAISHWVTSQELLVSALGMVELVAGILYNVGSVYAEMNDYEQSIASLKQCLTIRGAIHGEEHILYAQTIQKIGDVLLGMSDYQEALESYHWALDVMHLEPNRHRIDIGDILENMGNIHYSKGEVEEALQNYEDALRSKQVDLGEDHPELANTYQHIGNCLSDQEKTDEAVVHFEEAIRLKRLDEESGERDADILTIEGVLNNLHGQQRAGLDCYQQALKILVTKTPHLKKKVAYLFHVIGCVYLMIGEPDEAMRFFKECLQARRRVLGFVHLDVASTLFNMAFIHKTRNRLDSALKCLEDALKIRQLRLPNSEKVAVTHENIGSIARVIGKAKKAELAFLKALKIRRQLFGDDHEAVAVVLHELGHLKDDLGEYSMAIKYYSESLDIRERVLGEGDLAIADSYYSMGVTLKNSEVYDRAVQCLEKSLEIRKAQLGLKSEEVGDTLNMMGFLQAKRGDLEQSLLLLENALSIRKALGEEVKAAETLQNLGDTHRENHEFDQAVESYSECLQIRRFELGDDHEKVADSLMAMGLALADMEYNEEAMRSYKEGKASLPLLLLDSFVAHSFFLTALSIRTARFGEQDESVAMVFKEMGTLEFHANELERAFGLLDEFIRIRQENGAGVDEDYATVLSMIGKIHKMQGNEMEAQAALSEAYEVLQRIENDDLDDTPDVEAPYDPTRPSRSRASKRDSSADFHVEKPKGQAGILNKLKQRVKIPGKSRRKDRGLLL